MEMIFEQDVLAPLDSISIIAIFFIPTLVWAISVTSTLEVHEEKGKKRDERIGKIEKVQDVIINNQQSNHEEVMEEFFDIKLQLKDKKDRDD